MAGGVISETRTILLVDDEEMILDVVFEFLKVFGYDVLVAKGGREAVQIYEANRNKIDLVILDVLMPDMGGVEVIELLRKFDPEIKVLISSGLSLEDQMNHIRDLSSDGFVQKPFAMKTLQQRIEGILGDST